MIDDISSHEELSSLATDKAREINDAAEEDASALGIDLESAAGDPASEEAASDIETASSGNLSGDDYLNSRPTPNMGTGSDFERILEQGKSQLMSLAASNINYFTRRALVEADSVLDEIDVLLAEIGAEAAKVSLAAAAGLLVPPSKNEVRELRTETQGLHDVSCDAAEDLRAARARRDAAKRHLRTDDNVPPSLTAEGAKVVPNRFLEETTVIVPENRPTDMDKSYAAASIGALDLEAQSRRRGHVDQRVEESTAALQGSVLDKVGYIAICLAIAGLDKKRRNKDRAERLFRRLIAVIDTIMDSLDAGFLTTMQGLMQEAAADRIDAITDFIQDKLDAFDTWLGLQVPELPTFVSLVKAIGDSASDQPVLESLAAHCDLNFTSFCEFQGLLEVAKSLDAELGKFLPRLPAVGRARLIVLAPETDKERPTAEQPDRDTAMFLVEINGSDVVTRLPRFDVQPTFTTPTPPLAGQLAADVDAGAETMTVSGLAPNVAALGDVIIGSETLRYSRHDAGVFTLIDVPSINYLATTPVEVTGGHGDTFEDAFESSPNINGGAGELVLDGDGEGREKLAYTSSDFDAVTGHYTFHLITPPTEDHAFTMLCRPHATRYDLLYKGSDLVEPARRFRVQGAEIIPLNTAPDPGGGYSRDNNFDFTTGGNLVIDVSDYDGGDYLLRVGSEVYGVELDTASCQLTPPLSRLALKSDFHAGDQDRVGLSRMPIYELAGNRVVKIKLDARQKHDLGVSNLGIGASKTMTGRVILSGGQATGRARGITAHVARTNETLTITSKIPLVRGDEAGFEIEAQSGPTSFSKTIDSVTGAGQLVCGMDERTGLVTIAGAAMAGVGTKFLTEFAVGDYVHAAGSGTARIDNIASDAAMTLTTMPGDVLNQNVYMTMPEGDIGRYFSIRRTPQETREFTAVKNIDGLVYELIVATDLSYSHGLQEPEMTMSVKIVTNTVQAFLDHFADAADNVGPRFDGNTVPVGSTSVRAELETPESRNIVNAFVENAGHITAKGQDLDTTPPNVEDPSDEGTYTFNLVAGLPFPLADGEIIEIETMSVFDQLKIEFPTDWATPYDEFFAQLGDLLERLDKKICQLLSGRPMDLGLTAAAVTALILPMRATILLLRLTLATLILGLPDTETITKVLETFDKSGMDQAAKDVRAGDIRAVSQLTPATATSEGRARDAVQNYRSEVILFEDVKIADNLAATLTANEYDKELLAQHRRDHEDMARDQLNNEIEASKLILEDVETIA